MGAYWPQHNRWKYFILCVPLLTPCHLFSCTVCSHTKPKNSSFTLIFGICLTLSCSVEEDFLILLKRIVQQEKPSKVLPYTVTNMNELGSVRDAGLYSHPWSHTVFNGKLHVISAPAGSVVGEQRGTLRTNEGTCKGTSVQLLTNHHRGPSGMAAASLENEPLSSLEYKILIRMDGKMRCWTTAHPSVLTPVSKSPLNWPRGSYTWTVLAMGSLLGLMSIKRFKKLHLG